MIKYNKKLKKRLDLNINDYIEYFYSLPIEIELKVNNRYRYFIHISYEEKI